MGKKKRNRNEEEENEKTKQNKTKNQTITVPSLRIDIEGTLTVPKLFLKVANRQSI